MFFLTQRRVTHETSNKKIYGDGILSSNKKVQSPFNSFISKSWITVPEINPMDDVEENRLRKLIETIAEFMKISYYCISSEVVK